LLYLHFKLENVQTRSQNFVSVGYRYPTHFSICHSFLDIYIIGILRDIDKRFSVGGVIIVEGGGLPGIREDNTSISVKDTSEDFNPQSD